MLDIFSFPQLGRGLSPFSIAVSRSRILFFGFNFVKFESSVYFSTIFERKLFMNTFITCISAKMCSQPNNGEVLTQPDPGLLASAGRVCFKLGLRVKWAKCLNASLSGRGGLTNERRLHSIG